MYLPGKGLRSSGEVKDMSITMEDNGGGLRLYWDRIYVLDEAELPFAIEDDTAVKKGQIGH